MSHTDYAYPKPSADGLSLNHHGPWRVSEDNDRYATSLVRLTDAINERLAKAEALTRLMIGHEDYQRDGVITHAAWAIADLVDEARELYAQQWERVRQYTKPEG